MPLHDWTRVPAGLFHHFHQHWSIEIAAELNRGRLPKGASALVEQKTGQREPDVLTVETRGEEFERELESGDGGGGTLIASPPVAPIVLRSERADYARKANRIVVRHHLGRILAVIEIVSPGNKDGTRPLRQFVEKMTEFLLNGIHLLVIDPFPPTSRDPQGINKAIWDELEESDFELPPGKDRTLASYMVGRSREAYITPVGVGDELPDVPLFLTTDLHVMVPLEPTYQTAWQAAPEAFREAVETGVLPDIGDQSDD